MGGRGEDYVKEFGQVIDPLTWRIDPCERIVLKM